MTVAKQPPRRPTASQRHDDQVLVYTPILFGLGIVGLVLGGWGVWSESRPGVGVLFIFVGIVLCYLAIMGHKAGDLSLVIGKLKATMRRLR